MLPNTALRQHLRTTLSASPLLRPFNDRAAINGLLATIDPLWSIDRVRARIQQVVNETEDTRTLILRPNRRWSGFRAGQHVVIEVEIDGVRHHRSYSLSSAPADSSLALTVKRHADGLVSNWLHDHAVPDQVFSLSEAVGDFVLPASLPSRLLLIGAGSGITPLRSILRDLHARSGQGGFASEIVLLQISRNRRNTIFGHELRRLSEHWQAFKRISHYTADAGRLDADGLRRLLPERAQCHTLLCGPSDFMAMVESVWNGEGLGDRLRTEHFGYRPLRPTAISTEAKQVSCTRSKRDFMAGGQALLAEAEAAGLAPRHGCRIGICRGCQCRKLSGTTENLRTGEINVEPDQLIQLCITAARSDLRLDL